MATYFLAQSVYLNIFKGEFVQAGKNKYPIHTNTKGQINVSAWFKIERKKLAPWLKSKKFERFLKHYCKINKKRKNSLITKTTNGTVFMHVTLALYTFAVNLSPALSFAIQNYWKQFYKASEPAEYVSEK